MGFKVDKEFNSQGLFTGAAITLDNPAVRALAALYLSLMSNCRRRT